MKTCNHDVIMNFGLHRRASFLIAVLLLLVLAPLVQLIGLLNHGFTLLTPIVDYRYVPNCTLDSDFFDGRWVPEYQSSSLYIPGSCPFVEESFNCFVNGRPDSDFVHWRWKPLRCNIPRFNGLDLLEKMRGKRFVFVGDSLSRNQWESMVCLLREALPIKDRVFELNGEKITKDVPVSVFHFQDYDFRLEYYTTHFLVDEEYKTHEQNSSGFTLRLDKVHRSHVHWSNADVLVFTTGHWWTHGKTAKGRNFYQEGELIHRKLNLMVAFTKAMNTWSTWIEENVNPKKTLVFLSGYSVGHFRGGKWNSGGQCHRETQPLVDELMLPKYPEKMPVIEQVARNMKFPVKLLNVTKLSSYRSDGHPSVYGLNNSRNGYQDCSHWCLPGVPDVWNGILYAMLIRDIRN